MIAGYLPREDVRDAFISRDFKSHRAICPKAAVVGSASLRRQAQIRRLRPDLQVTLLRGNVQTRLAKLERGEVDATLLAMAGLRRLGLTDHVTTILDTDDFLPAVGQGAIAIAIRAEDERRARGARPDSRSADRPCARRRARLPDRSRRLLPHADRRAMRG